MTDFLNGGVSVEADGSELEEPWLRICWRDGPVTAEGCPVWGTGPRRVADEGAVPWAGWTWDGSALDVRCDRFGLYPLFYAFAEDAIVVARSLSTLMAHGVSGQLNDAAFAVFLRFWAFLAEETSFAKVHILPPGGRLCWNRGEGLTVTGGLWIPRRQQLSRRAAVTLYVEVFEDALHRLSEMYPPGVVPLSGGEDSRHILLALHGLGRPPRVCVTLRHHPPRADEDALKAALLARAAAVPHVVLDHGADRFWAETEKNRLTHFGAVEHAWFLPLTRYLAWHAGPVYDGLGGDVLSAGLFLDDHRLRCFDTGRFAQLAEEIMGDEGPLRLIVHPDALRRFSREMATERMARELARHADAPNPIGSFFFWNRTRRAVALAPVGMLGPVSGVVTPYLAEPVYDFLASLPASTFLDHGFHREAIALGYPAFAGVPYETKGVRAAGGFGSHSRFAVALAWHARRSRIFLRRGGVIPRALRCVVDPVYSESVTWFGPLATNLLQFERFLEEIGDAPAPVPERRNGR